MLKDLLESKNCFKLICGAGNQDTQEVEKLVAVYAKAGCKFFDVSASNEVVNAVKRGLEFAQINDAYICVSVGTKDDLHTNKAVIDEQKCVSCFSCYEVCPQSAIKSAKINQIRCIGCGKCAEICPAQAISFENKTADLDEFLPEIIKNGVDCIELHATGLDENDIENKWKYLNENFAGMLSICLGRSDLSNKKLIERIRKLIEIRKHYTTIIQADGSPMSGGKDDYRTTLQAVACAELVQNADLPVYILVSGGTNSKTKELAKMCGVDLNGVAIGSFARKIVKEFIDKDDLLQNSEEFNKAVNIAKSLI